jgi:hypothetical protein
MSAPRRLTLEAVAVCFEVEVTFLAQVCEVGLLRAQRGADGAWLVDVDELPRVARVVRLCLHHDLDVAVAALWIDELRR